MSDVTSVRELVKLVSVRPDVILRSSDITDERHSYSLSTGRLAGNSGSNTSSLNCEIDIGKEKRVS